MATNGKNNNNIFGKMGNRRIKINWLLILQAWTMLWVVIGHTPLMTDEDPCWAIILYKIAYSFHMPLFLLISGYLFYMTRIGGGNSWSYLEIVKDKLIRLGIPFVVFTFIAMIVKTLFPGDMARQVSFNLMEFVNAILYPGDGPLAELWFVAVIMWGFMLTPIWKRILNQGLLAEIGILILLIFIHFRGELNIDDDIHFLCISLAFNMMMWFYIGMLVCKYDVFNRICSSDKRALSCVVFGCVIYAASESNSVPLLPTLSAILFSLGLAKILDAYIPSAFFTFRNYTYQIFLMGIFFQIATKMVYKRIGMPYFGFYITCLLVGIYLPVIISRLIEKTNWKPMLLCIGLKPKIKRQ